MMVTFSWLMSARKRLCVLYRSSFKGSCQYWACTRLMNTRTTSSQCAQRGRQPHNIKATKRICVSREGGQLLGGGKGSNALSLNQVGVSATVQSFAYHVTDVGALSGTLRQPVHSWRFKKQTKKKTPKLFVKTVCNDSSSQSYCQQIP